MKRKEILVWLVRLDNDLRNALKRKDDCCNYENDPLLKYMEIKMIKILKKAIIDLED